MKSRRELNHRLDRVLRQAHRSRPGPAVDSRWAEAVMQMIRGIPVPEEAGGGWSFSLLVWRLAPATCALALLTLAALLQFSLIPDGELFRLWYSEPQPLSLAGF
jgi:hypothetical protein